MVNAVALPAALRKTGRPMVKRELTRFRNRLPTALWWRGAAWA